MTETTGALIVICGATATGKSGLALKLAERFRTKKRQSAILSADSRQVYREFNIGTAKPSIAEQKTVPHFLIDLCHPTEILTLADYQQQAQQLLARLQTDTLPLLVGGTGLYIRSIVRGLLIPRVAPQPDLRAQLQALGQPQCYAFLQQVDRSAAEKIHPNDRVRTLRALEVFYVTGRPISAQQGEFPPRYPILQIGLDCSVEALGNRIQRRTAQMIADGLVDEVRGLCQTYGTALPLLQTLGYQEIKEHLAGGGSLAEAEALIGLHTRQFAKQQRTWFKADRSIDWFEADCPDLGDRVWQHIQAFLADAAPTS